MSLRFLKFIPSEKADWLQENHPNAFLLLCLIAKRARRYEGHIDGLGIGMAYIGDYKSSGIETENKYRTAKKILVEYKLIEICETCRSKKTPKNTKKPEISKNHKNTTTSITTSSTPKRTTKGTIVKILGSDVWDINDENKERDNNLYNPHLNHDLITTSSRPDHDEQERRKKEERIYINKKTNKKGNAGFSAEASTLASYFLEKIREQLPSFKDPGKEKWAKDCDAILRIDGRPIAEAYRLINWALNNTFWKKNILSPGALRRQWDRLCMEISSSVENSVISKNRENFKMAQSDRERLRTYPELTNWYLEGSYIKHKNKPGVEISLSLKEEVFATRLQEYLYSSWS